MSSIELRAWGEAAITHPHPHVEPSPNLALARGEHCAETQTRERIVQQLAPVDGGSAAWGLLAAAFVFEALLWGKFSSLRLWPLDHFVDYYRLPYLFWSISKLLLRPSPICRKLQDSAYRHYTAKHELLRCSCLRCVGKALP